MNGRIFSTVSRLVGVASLALTMASAGEFRVERLLDEPIITPATHPSIGKNIQGPSLIRVPDWVENPMGKYYLYFADHKGHYIRLAYADKLTGPWSVHSAGSLQIAKSRFPVDPPPYTEKQLKEAEARRAASGRSTGLSHSIVKEYTTTHIASPDVHVDDVNKRIVMYFHGLESFGTQKSRVALSKDGIDFEAEPQILGRTYLRVFHHEGMTYGIAMPGQVYRSKDGFTNFETGPLLFNPDMRHCALLKRGDVVNVFWTQVGKAPEVVKLSTIDLSKPWTEWKEAGDKEILRPERDWEGANAPLVPSVRSTAYGTKNEIRDPAIYEEDGKVYLLYAVAGESGIAIARLHE